MVRSLLAMGNTYLICVYPTLSSAYGPIICAPSLSFFEYSKPEIDLEVCFLNVAVLCSKLLRSNLTLSDEMRAEPIQNQKYSNPNPFQHPAYRQSADHQENDATSVLPAVDFVAGFANASFPCSLGRPFAFRFKGPYTFTQDCAST
jgi:hypothetical protein